MKNIFIKSVQIVVDTTKFIVLCAVLYSCGNVKKDTSASEQAVIETEVAIEEDVWIIDEHQINDIPLTAKAKSPQEKVSDTKSTEVEENNDPEIEENEAEVEESEYEIYTANAIAEELEEQAYEATIVDVSEAIVPLDETQTIVSYNKKGKAEAAFQVISSGPDSEVEQIIFKNKKHTDVYNVNTGMSAKEVKRLRKEMKHMVKKGKVFLYDDNSNVMYLLDAQDMAGDEVTAADIENMDVQAIIWQDKKHHRKNK